MLELCDNIIHNKPPYPIIKNLEKDVKKELFTLLDQKEYRLHFLTYLNYKRSCAPLKLGKKSFKYLGEIMVYMVKRIEIEKDFETLRYCIILSQTYYFVNIRNEKFYIVRYIDDYPLFKQDDFWNFYYVSMINQGLEELNANKKPTDTEEDRERQKGHKIFSKILAVAHNMMEFRITRETILKYVQTYSQQNNLSQELEENIILAISDIKYEEKKPFREDVDIVDGNEESSSKSEAPVKKKTTPSFLDLI